MDREPASHASPAPSRSASSSSPASSPETKITLRTVFALTPAGLKYSRGAHGTSDDGQVLLALESFGARRATMADIRQLFVATEAAAETDVDVTAPQHARIVRNIAPIMRDLLARGLVAAVA